MLFFFYTIHLRWSIKITDNLLGCFVASNTAYGFRRAVQTIAPIFDWNGVRGLVGTNKTYCIGLLIRVHGLNTRDHGSIMVQ